MLGDQPPFGAWPSIDAGSHRTDIERGMGVALTVLLHLGLLALFLLHPRQPVTPPLVQATTVVNMQLIPQAWVTPAAISQAKPTVRPQPRSRPVQTKPATVEPEQRSEASSAPASVAAPGSAAQPPQPASAGIVEPLPVAYLTRVMITIGLNRRYPLKALANRETGTVVVHIRLKRDGTVLDVVVIKSSGSAALDD